MMQCPVLGNGQYVVSVNVNGSGYNTLANPDGASHEMRKFVAGGQLIEIETLYCVDLATVLRAASQNGTQGERAGPQNP